MSDLIVVQDLTAVYRWGISVISDQTAQFSIPREVTPAEVLNTEKAINAYRKTCYVTIGFVSVGTSTETPTILSAVCEV